MTNRTVWWTGCLAAVSFALACVSEEALREDAGTGGTGGAGGCSFDGVLGYAGATPHDAVVPAPGSWCPQNGFELCTDRTLALYPDDGDPRLYDDAGTRVDPAGVLSRCVGNAWQTVAGVTCESPFHDCNVFREGDVDGQCCLYTRNCQQAFCDGTRWWTRR